jgi:hypothetical protein
MLLHFFFNCSYEIKDGPIPSTSSQMVDHFKPILFLGLSTNLLLLFFFFLISSFLGI